MFCGFVATSSLRVKTAILTLQVRAESPMEHIVQGKRSDTLGPPVLEQSRPVRAKALKCALDFYRTAIFLFIFPTRDASPPLEVAFVGGVLCLKKRKLLRLKKRKL